MYIGQGLSLKSCRAAQAERRAANTATATASAAAAEAAASTPAAAAAALDSLITILSVDNDHGIYFPPQVSGASEDD